MLGAFITSPVGGPLLALESARGGGAMPSLYFWILFPSMLASATATVIFVVLTGSFYGTVYVFPEYLPTFRDLLQAVPLGAIGGAVGVVFFILLRLLQRSVQPMKNCLVLRGLLGGLARELPGPPFRSSFLDRSSRGNGYRKSLSLERRCCWSWRGSSW